jgi:hypothetical protein
MRFTIEPGAIATARDLVTDLDVEVCGFLIRKTGTEYVSIFIDTYGSKSSCEYTNYTPIIFHTHTYKSKAYPSEQDIFKVLKERSDRGHVQSSIIFCSWGIWEISANEKIEESKLDPGSKKQILDSIKITLDKVYFATKKGRGDFSLKAKDLISCIEDSLNMNISLTLWSDVPQSGYRLETDVLL